MTGNWLSAQDLWGCGSQAEMKIEYDERADLLYLRLDPRPQDVTSRRVSQEMVLDLGKEEKIVGIEIMNTSKNLDLTQVRFDKVG